MSNETQFGDETPVNFSDASSDDALIEKLSDAMTPGFLAECDPIEAERAGAFVEDAMSEGDALASTLDLNAAMEQNNG